MTLWLVLAVNSITFGGLLFLLSAGFSLIFGLMRIPNLTHGSLFMLGAYFGATFIGGYLALHFDFWIAALLAALLVAAFGARGRAPAAAATAGTAAGAGAGHARHLFHGGRFLPAGVGRRSDQRRHAGAFGWLRARRAGGVSALSSRRHRHRHGDRARTLAAARPHAARRHDPRRRRRSRHGAGGRHPRFAAVHHRVCARFRPGGLRRHHRRAHFVGLSRPRPGHAAAGAGGGDPRRQRQPARLLRRQHHRRLHL